MKEFGDIVAGIIMLAILSLILSPKSESTRVVQSAFSSFNKILGVVVSPISTKGQ